MTKAQEIESHDPTQPTREISEIDLTLEAPKACVQMAIEMLRSQQSKAACPEPGGSRCSWGQRAGWPTYKTPSHFNISPLDNAIVSLKRSARPRITESELACLDLDLDARPKLSLARVGRMLLSACRTVALVATLGLGACAGDGCCHAESDQWPIDITDWCRTSNHCDVGGVVNTCPDPAVPCEYFRTEVDSGGTPRPTTLTVQVAPLRSEAMTRHDLVVAPRTAGASIEVAFDGVPAACVEEPGGQRCRFQPDATELTITVTAPPGGVHVDIQELGYADNQQACPS